MLIGRKLLTRLYEALLAFFKINTDAIFQSRGKYWNYRQQLKMARMWLLIMLKLRSSHSGENPSGPGAFVLLEFANSSSNSCTEITGIEPILASMFSARQLFTSLTTAEWFSELAESERKKPALKAFRISAGSVSVTPSSTMEEGGPGSWLCAVAIFLRPVKRSVFNSLEHRSSQLFFSACLNCLW